MKHDGAARLLLLSASLSPRVQARAVDATSHRRVLGGASRRFVVRAVEDEERRAVGDARGRRGSRNSTRTSREEGFVGTSRGVSRDAVFVILVVVFVILVVVVIVIPVVVLVVVIPIRVIPIPSSRWSASSSSSSSRAWHSWHVRWPGKSGKTRTESSR